MGNWQTLWLKRQPFTKLRVYTYKKGMQKTIQNIHRTLHNPLHLFDYLNVTRCRICVLNPTQTLHWNRHKPYTETGKTLHWNGQNPTLKPAKNLHWRGQNPTQKLYTKAYTATLHSVFWTRIKRMERMNANESCGTNGTNMTNKTNMASLLQADSSLSL